MGTPTSSHHRLVKIATLLGLNGIERATICIGKTASADNLIRITFQLSRLNGLLAHLDTAPALLTHPPEAYFFTAEGQVNAREFIPVLQAVELQLFGLRHSPLHQGLAALSRLTGLDAKKALLDPLTGQFEMGLVLANPSRKEDKNTIAPARYIRLGASSTQAAQALMQAASRSALPLNMTRKAHDLEWSFDIGFAELNDNLPLFSRLSAQSLLLGNGPAALDFKTSTPLLSAKSHFFEQASLAAHIDVRRLYYLLKRVGRKEDVEQWIEDFGLGNVVNRRARPWPASLLEGVEDISAVLKKTHNTLTLEIYIKKSPQ